MKPTPENRLVLLKQHISEAGGDVLEGLRRHTGESTSATCRRLRLGRTSVQLCLDPKYGRRYESTRRALELGLHLPPYSLDPILDKEPTL